MKPNYIIIPLITILTSVTGSFFTSQGMDWYKTINLPAWTPEGSFIGGVWTTIFILTTISALIVWNKSSKTPFNKRLRRIIIIFIANAALNVFWSFLFFTSHLIGLAVLEAVLLDISVIILIILIWPISKLASILLLPYAGWVAFATYLTYVIWTLNK